MKFQIEMQKDGKLKVLKTRSVARGLNSLQPGKYHVTIEPVSTRLLRMIRFYYKMEMELSLFLGITDQTIIHEEFKKYLGNHVNPDTGKPEYKSISKITEPSEMLIRIYEFQEFAARYWNYKMEPFKDDEQDDS